MTQKVLRIGSSAGMTFSKDALKKLGIQIGDEISVLANETGIHVTPVKKVIVDPELEALKDK
jgi:antitoxin component of MazEF toxin-antitoxin module